MEPIKVSKISSITVRLFPNRVEIEKPHMFGKQTEVILLKSITGVNAGYAKQLEVTTADGKKHNLAISGKAAEEMKQAILENIS
jgi:hypothetical protein